MILKLKSIDDTEVSLSDFSLEDFRTISSYIELEDDDSLNTFLTKNLSPQCSYNKFVSLLYLRKETVNENVNFTVDNKTIKISLNVWLNNFRKNFKPIKSVKSIEDFVLTMDYPRELYHTTVEELMMDCLYNIVYRGKELDVAELSLSEKYELFGRLSPKITSTIMEFIEENNTPILVMESRIGLPEISVNFFDNSGFDILKNLFNYYTYENILETIFMLSKRISDISYLNSRTPRDLDILIKLYSEEVEKTTDQTKSYI